MYLDAAQIDASNRIRKSNLLMLKYYDVLIFVSYLDILLSKYSDQNKFNKLRIQFYDA